MKAHALSLFSFLIALWNYSDDLNWAYNRKDENF